MTDVEAIIIGGGQAGLAASHELTAANVDHVVLERHRIGHGWRSRWDSFCLVTPNWTVQLPGFAYDGDDPDGFMHRDEIVAYLQRYAASFKAPVRESAEVTSVRGGNGSGFVVETGEETYRGASLVLATGAFQRPHRPAGADSLPDSLLKIDIGGYRNPEKLPPGDVLVIGSGQTGCQIAHELHEAGRRVVLSCGRAPWGPRRVGDHDLVWWLVESGFLEARADSLPQEARLFANILATGHDGGYDLHLRTLREMGVTLAGHFIGASNGKARFAPDLGDSLAWGDARHDQLVRVIQDLAEKKGMADPQIAPPDPFDTQAPDDLDLTGFGTVLFTGGFRPDFTSWLPWPDAFDDHGFPIQHDGTSTVVGGLHFLGTHFLRKRKSALLIGIGEDAGVVAAAITSR